ncbi:hypothetical protein CYMTET_34390 [Cymbomonas tetramitiformis]|uniref:Uncharacterized protein n=1 Tax=Cymbomonas tetramitiformis TaxID=36881 RepID=A0AAE0KQ84_9CHLO|nr:hypothetical protein CYMTET_34390 [Cymbomonas tetramitiformis]
MDKGRPPVLWAVRMRHAVQSDAVGRGAERIPLMQMRWDGRAELYIADPEGQDGSEEEEEGEEVLEEGVWHSGVLDGVLSGKESGRRAKYGKKTWSAGATAWASGTAKAAAGVGRESHEKASEVGPHPTKDKEGHGGTKMKAAHSLYSLRPTSHHFTRVCGVSTLHHQAPAVSTFYIQAFDDQKHPQAHGGAFFQAVLTGPAIVMGTVRDFDNGWYEVKLRLHEAGHYKRVSPRRLRVWQRGEQQSFGMPLAVLC